MLTVAYLFAAALVAVAIYFGVRYFVKASRRFGGGRVIICPETKSQAMVEVDARRAALTSLIGQTEIRLESCWRWPLREDCGQECLLQLDVAPAECLVRSVLMKWYRGRKCAFCEKPFGEIELIDHKPALLNPEGVTVEWAAIPISVVNDAMANYLPVCWDCHVAQTFRREHPDLVVERPAIKPASQTNLRV
ncbi:MAG TPA: HNH endonuclease [Pyrinomonadaceae bacterium]|nr:HNH endonuclease [Pyrinomonadaceae bacterium]